MIEAKLMSKLVNKHRPQRTLAASSTVGKFVGLTAAARRDLHPMNHSAPLIRKEFATIHPPCAFGIVTLDRIEQDRMEVDPFGAVGVLHFQSRVERCDTLDTGVEGFWLHALESRNETNDVGVTDFAAHPGQIETAVAVLLPAVEQAIVAAHAIVGIRFRIVVFQSRILGDDSSSEFHQGTGAEFGSAPPFVNDGARGLTKVTDSANDVDLGVIVGVESDRLGGSPGRIAKHHQSGHCGRARTG